MSISQQNLIVWDVDEALPSEYESVLLWRSYVTSGSVNIISIPELIEDNAVDLRSKYLSFIYDLGETIINGKRVIEHLELRPGFSYWWMTLLSEKCNFAKSPQIDNIIKLMTFKEWFKEKDYKHILLASSNAKLADAMKSLADDFGVGFEWKKNGKEKATKSLVKRIYNSLPYSLQAFFWLLRYLVTRWPLKGIGVSEWKKTRAKTTFISYLVNLVPGSEKKGNYESRYWTELPKMLDEHQVKSNWLHIYVENDLLPNSSKARSAIKHFNQSHTGSQVHVTLDSFLSIKLIFSVLSDWYEMFKLKKNLRVPLQRNSGIYWSFIEKDFLNSFSGPAAMSNLLFLNLFQSAMEDLPLQEKGCYLQENQGWELGLVNAWRAAGHANYLVGIPHTLIKFWDLRYYFDKRCYGQSDRYSLPLPDYVGMNGETAKKMYLSGGYPEDLLIEVEALRYLHLNSMNKHHIDSIDNEASNKVLLVCGDYLKKNTAQQMELLLKASKYIDFEIQYLIKPHPLCPILSEDYPELNLIVTDEPISMLIESSSLIYTSNTTSAAVDAYCLGKTVVTVLDPISLNLSPLKGIDGVWFVSSPEELAAVLKGIGDFKEIKGKGKDYFYLDPALPRWKELLVKTDKTEKKTGMKGIQ